MNYIIAQFYVKAVEPIQLWIRTKSWTLHVRMYPRVTSVTLKTVSPKITTICYSMCRRVLSTCISLSLSCFNECLKRSKISHQRHGRSARWLASCVICGAAAEHKTLFISVFNQLDAQNLFHNKFHFMPLHVSSICVHHQEVKIVLHSL